MLNISQIAQNIESHLSEQLNGSGIMFRMFSRVKTAASIRHKLHYKGDCYLSGKKKIQDVIGLRIVVYFSDDIEVLSLLLNNKRVVKRAVDEPDSCTFSPQRLNLTIRLPERYEEDFKAQLPQEVSQYIDTTYEIQIRTIFSEGWHEIEHDLRYKCKEDWVGYETYSRRLNGVIATLETAEWSIQSIFHEMTSQNLRERNYSAMLRNKFRIRLTGKGLSPELDKFLRTHSDVAKAIIDIDRVIFVFSLLNHQRHIVLSYDNILFLINRMEIMNPELLAMESETTRNEIVQMLHS